jgi:hypothetical protein
MFKPHSTARRETAHEAFAQTLRRNSPTPVTTPPTGRDDISSLGMSAFQLVSQSLEGPFGLHAPTLFAAFGALAGYAAKWAVALDIADGLAPNDFRVQSGEGGRNVLFSDRVHGLIAGLDRQSVLSIVLGAATRANAGSLQALSTLSQRIVLPGAANAMPDYGIDKRWMPQFAPEALLMMLWENSGRAFRAERRPRSDLALGFAFAAAHAVTVWRERVPAEVSALLVLESALAMGKIDRAF